MNQEELLRKDIYDSKDTEIELTNLCNAKCPLCYRNNIEYIQGKAFQRPLNEVINQLDKFTKLESIKLVGTISEPTLYKYFFELIEYLNTRDIEIEICTNGDTNNENWWELLGKLLKPKDKVFFTICGSTQELHEVYRKGTNLNNIIKNANAFRNKNKNDYAQLIRFNYNDDNFNTLDIIETVSYFSNLYWTETFLALPREQYKNMDEDLYDKLKPFKAKYKIYKLVAEQSNKKLLFQNIKPVCIAKEDSTSQINIKGEVLPCYLFTERFSPDTKINEEIRKNWSYEKINNGDYDCCKFCDKNIRGLLQSLDLRYII